MSKMGNNMTYRNENGNFKGAIIPSALATLMNVTEPEAICATVARILDLFLLKSRSVNIVG